MPIRYCMHMCMHFELHVQVRNARQMRRRNQRNMGFVLISACIDFCSKTCVHCGCREGQGGRARCQVACASDLDGIKLFLVTHFHCPTYL
ncbi:hypothetical protein DUNSADRAFT_17424 [Dunaliella salina]|uniref:Encoded protein n=1 Tax=Dunaliella salina TaxID=3046 RepID=A0ABQ7H025_DUNSA|nr:hypothetical protein DUNSADRAFT_17424 [Dunaliella salina]|eukprot:KAF5840207.1 hypothetical protein DUNSADRAFT_17424 [Dunaliella salina]